MSASDNNAKIVDYWRRRRTLTVPEWEDFYRRVTPLLLRTRLPDEYGDPARRLELVTDFFEDKILLNAATTKAGLLDSAHALHGYLKNYVRDRLRGETDPPPDPAGPDAVDNLAAEPEGLAEAQLLKEAGIDVSAAEASADEFVDKILDEHDRLLLRHDTCAPVEPESIHSIGKRYLIKSPHHKARQLGITRNRGDIYRDYHMSKIGKWLSSLGARIEPDWRLEIAALLNLLCRQLRLRYAEDR